MLDRILGLDTLVIESTVLGGQAGTSRRIENYLVLPARSQGSTMYLFEGDTAALLRTCAERVPVAALVAVTTSSRPF